MEIIKSLVSAIKGRDHKLKALEARLAALESSGLSLEGFDVGFDGERTLTVRLGSQEKKFTLAIPIYQGTFKDGQEYTVGDCVTHGGSMWVAKVDAPEGRPGDGLGNWQLCVKRGKDMKGPKETAQ